MALECKRTAATGLVVSNLSNIPLQALPSNTDPGKDQESTCRPSSRHVRADVDVREVYFLIMHFLSDGPCRKACAQLKEELEELELLPRRFHAWYSRTGLPSGENEDDGTSVPLTYNQLLERFSFIEKNHLVKLLEELFKKSTPLLADARHPMAADVPTLLGSGSVTLLSTEECETKQAKWHWNRVGQNYGMMLREIGGGLARHHQAPSIRAASYQIIKPSVLVNRIQNIKTIRGHRNAVYCAIFDKSGEYIITGSDDRLVKIWSTTTGFCLCSCRGHEGDITDLAVSANNLLLASASNDCFIRVWRFPVGFPVSVLKAHTGAVTAIAFSPRQGCEHHLLSTSDDGTCRIWDARDSSVNARVYAPRPDGQESGAKSMDLGQQSAQSRTQILCCAFNASGTVFVTGSADKLARVWDACKWTDDVQGGPNNEFDTLKGHEDDVNYVQFSGCAAPSRPTNVDIRPVNLGAPVKNERISRFRNSWFGYESIVSCSRDGSAIIWVPRPRKYHGKSKWTKGYHLRVPPPPMPVQPYRGIPRQRLLPTPRGVNMIVWSLDNRYVLAAIMDCRICVWNAADGVLVHSLTGHTKSTFVLDVHPYDPRIAMSAGYDGRVIIWNIREGRSIHEYKIGDFHLVDGKFSPDGTSIVISDEVGQIYVLATGEGRSQKDAKYDQFFLGDYQPLSRDVHGNVLDQETQLSPHERNMRDLLCDASMIPYAEPYQSTYQQRRLGAIGRTWHPPPAQWVTGSSGDSSYLTVAFPLLPPPAEDEGVSEGHHGGMRWVEQPFDEEAMAMAMEWEQETVDDAGSDYTLSLDNECDEDERDCSLSSSEELLDSLEEEEEEDFCEEGEFSLRASLRRSKRNKGKEEDLTHSTGGRSSKRKQREGGGRDYALRKSKRRKEIKRCSRNVLSRRSPDGEPSTRRRPKRLAARNARLFFSQIGAEENEHSITETPQGTESEEEEEMSSRQSLKKEESDKSSAEKVDDGSTADGEPCEGEWRCRPRLYRSGKHRIFTRRSSKGETSGQTGASAFSGEEENLEMQGRGPPLRSDALNDVAFLQEEYPDIHGDRIRGTSSERQEVRDSHEISGLLQRGGKRRREESSSTAIKSPRMGSLNEAPAQLMEDGDPSRKGGFRHNSSREGVEASLHQTGMVEPSRQLVSGDGGHESDTTLYDSMQGDGGGVGLVNENSGLDGTDDAVCMHKRVSSDNGLHENGLYENCVWDAKLLDEAQMANSNLCGMGVNKQATEGGQRKQIRSDTHHDGRELDKSGRLKRVHLEDGLHKPDLNVSCEEAHVKDHSWHHNNHQSNVDHHMKQENDSETSGRSLDENERTREGGCEARNYSSPPPVKQTHKPSGDALRRHQPMGTSWQHNSPISLWLREGTAEAPRHKQSSSSEVECRDHENRSSGDDMAGLRHPLRLKFRKGKRRMPRKKMEPKVNSPIAAAGSLQEVKDIPGEPCSEKHDSGMDDELLSVVNVTRTYVRTRRNQVTESGHRPDACKSSESGLRTERREGLRPSLRPKTIANDGDLLGKVTRGGFWKGKGSNRKESWLMLVKVEDGMRYIPQLGDEVAYILQGHEEFPKLGRLEERSSASKGDLKARLRAVEMCRVVGMEYKKISGFNGVSCRLMLRLTDEECPVVGQTFRVSLPELTDFPDFIIDRNRYEVSIRRKWRKRDRCKVWWRTSSLDDDGEEERSGQWFIGRIMGVEMKSPRFPDSPWESCLVQYLGDSTGPLRHSPWELFDVDSCFDDEKMPSCLDDGTQLHLLATIEDIEESNQIEYGLDALAKLVRKSDFLNRTLVPLSLETIRERLRNEYYRSLEAYQHDVQLLATNVEMYLSEEDDLTCKVQALADRLLKEAGES